MIDKSNKYYVYLHRRLDNDEVFYVGKGCDDRAFSQSKRNYFWRNIIKQAGGCRVEFVEYGLTEKEAINLEENLILKYKNISTNVTNNAKVTEIDYNRLSEVFVYDETSSTCLRWKCFAGRGCQTKKPGDEAGYATTVSRYGRVWLDGKMILIHRAIWILNNKKIIPEGMQINHIDCNPMNNKIENLELVSLQQNMNLKRKKSDYKVIKNKNGDIISIQVAHLDESKNRKHKNFQIKTNIEDTVTEALNFKKEMLSKVKW